MKLMFFMADTRKVLHMFSFKLHESPIREVAVCPSLFFEDEKITGVQMNHEGYP